MKSLLISVLTLVLTLGLTFGSTQADAAKRLGGGKSLGMQRQVTPPPAKAPQAAPAQTPAAPAAAAAATPGRSWMGPLAGLAAGIGLAALASHFGFGEELANMMMIALLVMVVLAVIGFVMRRRAGPQVAMAGASAHQYSGTGAPQAAARVHEVAMPSGGGAAPQPMTVPEGFDVAGFTRNAKVSFIRLQAANDAGNLDDLREFTTPEMFAELKMNIDERGKMPQFTNVLDLQADVLEVAEEPTRYVVSVRFTGQVREGEAAAEAIDEIWHLSKPRDGASGWLLSGIQQSH
jgi:predicted lipid-binding transport protein (Tim44 family)